MFELANQSRPGIFWGGGLRRQELKQCFRQSCSTGNASKLVCFLSIETCKPLLLVTHEYNYEPEKEHNMFPLINPADKFPVSLMI